MPGPEANPLPNLPRQIPALIVCPKCHYAYADQESKDRYYACPRPECGHRWEALTQTAQAVHRADRRVAWPELRVLSGAPAARVELPEGESLIGREPESRLLLESHNVSRRHALIIRQDERAWVEDLKSTRGTKLNGRPLSAKTQLVPGDELNLGGIVIAYAVRFEAAGHAGPIADELPLAISQRHAVPEDVRRTAAVVPLNKGRLTIGRDRDRDVVLTNMLISRKHALIEHQNGKYYLSDTQSLIGTFVNGKSIIRTALEPGDRIQVGPYLFRFDGSHLTRIHELSAFEVVAAQLSQSAGKVEQLDNVSLVLKPGELVGLLGPAGAGKTTLLDALAGVRPARTGQVFINGQPLYDEYLRLRRLIGYVPHEEIVHRELTPRQALGYVGRLRLPGDVSEGELADLVKDTLEAVDLAERGDVPIARLSPIERKRASVGVELLCRPGILFLDEPTLGLDPAAESNLLRRFKRLASQGRTVVCAMHVMENVDVFDKVAVLSPGGKLAYFGPAGQAKTYFGIDKFTQLYDRLAEKPPDNWQQRYRQSDLRREHLAAVKEGASTGVLKTPIGGGPASLLVQQAATLSRRFGRILLSDASNQVLFFAQPLVMATLIGLVFRSMPMMLFLATVSALWLGCTNAVLQIVKERSILRRERRVNLRLDAYVSSKFLVLGGVSAVQSALMLGVLWLFGGGGNFVIQLAAVMLAAWNGVAMGLIISALARTADQALFAAPLCLLPQFLLAGGFVPVEQMHPAAEVLSFAAIARYANEAVQLSFVPFGSAKGLPFAFGVLVPFLLAQLLAGLMILKQQDGLE